MDRFIVDRSSFSPSIAEYNLRRGESLAARSLDTSPANEEYKRCLARSLFSSASSSSGSSRGISKRRSSVGSSSGSHALSSLLGGSVDTLSEDEPVPSAVRSAPSSPLSSPTKFQSVAPAEPLSPQADQRALLSATRLAARASRQPQHRSVPKEPTLVLESPELIDDYYLNLLDWSSTNDLAVALNRAVYRWNGDTKQTTKMLEVRAHDDYVASVSWMDSGRYLAVGTARADLILYDVEAQKRVRVLRGHRGRVTSLSWNGYMLSSGSRDTTVRNWDVRVREAETSRFRGHVQEVCGLKWQPTGNLCASGSNDNLLNIHELRRPDAPLFTMRHHRAAVKGLAWCPWDAKLLASGGGTADRMIRLWDTTNGACLNAVDTKSQVCSLLWSSHYRELVSSHGFSLNQLILWKHPTMTKMAELTGHSARVLHMAMSPDGQTVVSASGDATLRFWNIFERYKSTDAARTAQPTSRVALRPSPIR